MQSACRSTRKLRPHTHGYSEGGNSGQDRFRRQTSGGVWRRTRSVALTCTSRVACRASSAVGPQNRTISSMAFSMLRIHSGSTRCATGFGLIAFTAFQRSRLTTRCGRCDSLSASAYSLVGYSVCATVCREESPAAVAANAAQCRRLWLSRFIQTARNRWRRGAGNRRTLNP